MAPLTQQVADDVKSTIAGLEARIAELEAKLSGHGGSSSSSSDSNGVRMILIGPPGAGEPSLLLRRAIGLGLQFC